jgi:hypothetical protein
VDVYGPDGVGGLHVLQRVDMRQHAASASRDAPLVLPCAGADDGEVRVERWAAGGFAPLSSFRAHSSRLGTAGSLPRPAPRAPSCASSTLPMTCCFER